MQIALQIDFNGRVDLLNFENTARSGEKHGRTTQIRHSDAVSELIERASTILGVEKSVFLRQAIIKEAQRILEESTRHSLSEEDAQQFLEALDSPPRPTARAREAAGLYHQRVEHAD